MSRPKLPVDKGEIEKWARAGSSIEEIAAKCGVSERTLNRRLQTKEFRDLIPKAQAELKISLRTKQVQMALAGNVTMLIWTGKQYLGQRDKWDTDLSGTVEHTGQVDIRAAIMQVIQKLPEESRAVVARGLLELEKAG